MLSKLFAVAALATLSKGNNEEILGFSISTAQKALHLAGAAYCSSNSLKNWNCGSPCSYFNAPTNIVYLNDDTLQVAGFVATFSGSASVVSFRGTVQNIQDWIDDLTFEKVPYSLCDNCETHEGFTEAFNALSTQMYDALTSLNANGPLLVTGHSLGGAIATLAALDLLNNGYQVSNLYTYGGPRVGNAEFAYFTSYMANTTSMVVDRIIHYADLVPHLPPESFGFTHAPKEIFFTEDSSSYTICNSVNGEDGNCSDSVPDWDLSVSDHLNYMNYAISGSCIGN